MKWLEVLLDPTKLFKNHAVFDPAAEVTTSNVSLPVLREEEFTCELLPTRMW